MKSNIRVVFEWNPEKAHRNRRKHQVSFADASTAFGDPLSLTIADPDHSTDEERYILLGQTHTGQLVVVVHTVREGDPEQIRLISARIATEREKRSYHDG